MISEIIQILIVGLQVALGQRLEAGPDVLPEAKSFTVRIEGKTYLVEVKEL